MSDADPTARQERRELTALLWFFWAGILVSSAGESALIFLMDRADNVVASGATGTHTLVVGGLAVSMWTLAGLVYRKQLGGGGFPTAIFCWMLAKATSILGFGMYFLSPGWGYTWLLLGGYLAVMALLRPTKFLGDG